MSTETTEETSEQPLATKANRPQPQPLARIIKYVPRDEPFKKSARERKLGGTYRVIHGNVAIPRPKSEWTNADGSVNIHEPRVEYAIPGDEIALGHEDAARMIDADIVEPLDAKPSRLGKVWDPTKGVLNSRSAER